MGHAYFKYKGAYFKYILEIVARTNFHVLNEGNVSTLHRSGYGETIPNISLEPESTVNQIYDW